EVSFSQPKVTVRRQEQTGVDTTGRVSHQMNGTVFVGAQAREHAREHPRSVADTGGRRQRDHVGFDTLPVGPKLERQLTAQMAEVVVTNEFGEAEHAGNEIDTVRRTHFRAWRLAELDVSRELKVET